MSTLSIKEALDAKRQAEETIRQTLRQLSADTGMQVHNLALSFTYVSRLGEDQVNLVTEVAIDLRL